MYRELAYIATLRRKSCEEKDMHRTTNYAYKVGQRTVFTYRMTEEWINRSTENIWSEAKLLTNKQCWA